MSNVARFHKLLAFVSLFCFVAPADAAQGQVPASPTGQQIVRTFVTLSVNGNQVGDALVALIAKDVYLRVSDLQRSGITKFGGTRRTIVGDEYVSLGSLAPDFTYTFDQKALMLSVIAHQASLLGSQTIDLRGGFPTDTRFVNDRGAFVNYALSGTTGLPTNGFVEAGVDLSHALLYGTTQFSRSAGLSLGIAQMIFDNREKLRRTIIGDAPIDTGSLGGAAILSGLSITRAFTLNPYIQTFPTPTFRGSVLLPSQADIYVNGQLVKTIQLSPGQFVLQDIPTQIGPSRTQVVIRNALGTVTQSAPEFFSGAGLLQPGLTDYGYGVGLLRANQSATSFTRGTSVAMGRYAVGINNRLTMGGRIEAGNGTVSGGGNLAVSLGFLAFQLGVAGSRHHGVGGAAGMVQLNLPALRRFGLSAFAQWMSPHYSTVSLGPDDARDTLDFGGTASVVLSRTTAFSLSDQHIENSKNGALDVLSAQFTQQLGSGMSLAVQAGRSRGLSLLGNANQSSLNATLIRSFGHNAVATISEQTLNTPTGSTHSTGVTVARSLSGEYGIAYDAAANFGNGQNASAAVAYQGALGNGQFLYSHLPGGSFIDFSYSGGLALVRNHFFLTRTIGDAFGLVDAQGLSGAPVYANDKFEGSTNRAGFLFIPDLTSEVPNQVRLSLPPKNLNSTISSGIFRVVPSYRGAAVFSYAVQRVHAILLNLLIQRKTGKSIVPQYGVLTLTRAGSSKKSEVDADGRAYFNDLDQGQYAAHIEYQNDICDFSISVPARVTALLNLGTLTCIEH